MFTNYFIYLNTISKEEQIKQILILLASFAILLSICGILKFIKWKFINKTKNNIFQKFLKQL